MHFQPNHTCNFNCYNFLFDVHLSVMIDFENVKNYIIEPWSMIIGQIAVYGTLKSALLKHSVFSYTQVNNYNFS